MLAARPAANKREGMAIASPENVYISTDGGARPPNTKVQTAYGTSTMPPTRRPRSGVKANPSADVNTPSLSSGEPMTSTLWRGSRCPCEVELPAFASDEPMTRMLGHFFDGQSFCRRRHAERLARRADDLAQLSRPTSR